MAHRIPNLGKKGRWCDRARASRVCTSDSPRVCAPRDASARSEVSISLTIISRVHDRAPTARMNVHEIDAYVACRYICNLIRTALALPSADRSRDVVHTRTMDPLTGARPYMPMHAWVIAVVTPRARARHRPPRRRCVPSDNPPSPAAPNVGIEISGAVKKIASVVALCRY